MTVAQAPSSSPPPPPPGGAIPAPNLRRPPEGRVGTPGASRRTGQTGPVPRRGLRRASR